MGGPKALARDPEGTAWVVRTTRVLAASGCAPVLVVVGAAAAQVMAELTGEPVELVEATDWQEGMGASLRAGLTALEQHREQHREPAATLVVPVDVPGLTEDVVRRIAAGADPTALVRAVYGGSPGHPVLLGRDHWSGVLGTAVGDQGARPYLMQHPPREIECSDLADGADVDTVAQLPAGHRPS
jgi:CTP:molybdopterin cytidylyltransferase MocA